MNNGKQLAISGYGRFGAALGELAIERGFQVTAYDPTADIPEGQRANSLAELCNAASTVMLCVPLEHFEASLREIRPHLRREHLVLDVGSVKLEPIQALRSTLGDEIPWVGTHPLFGPTSLARGDRPLRVVLCEGSETALQRARDFWTTLGCDWLEQSAEDHDHAMARSHALAFFLAKGLLDIRAGEGAAFTPPSFEAIGKTITAVRSDAGHLFRSIQNRNPFAAEERGRLIEALRRIDGELAQPEDLVGSSASARTSLTAEPQGEESAPLLLEELDRELLALLARRALLSTRVTGAERARAEKALADAAAGLDLDPGKVAALARLFGEE